MNISEKLNEKRKEYEQYIREHQRNVKKVFNYVEDNLKGIPENVISLIRHNINIHDQSKFESEEFNGYRQHFFHVPDFENPDESKDDFEISWQHHKNKNSHHWEYWVTWDDDTKELFAHPMRDSDLIEMLCDWTAMSMKFNNKPSKWFEKNCHKMILHDMTKSDIKFHLSTFDNAFEHLKNMT